MVEITTHEKNIKLPEAKQQEAMKFCNKINSMESIGIQTVDVTSILPQLTEENNLTTHDYTECQSNQQSHEITDVLSYYQNTSNPFLSSKIPANPITVTQCYNVQTPHYHNISQQIAADRQEKITCSSSLLSEVDYLTNVDDKPNDQHNCASTNDIISINSDSDVQGEFDFIKSASTVTINKFVKPQINLYNNNTKHQIKSEQNISTILSAKKPKITEIIPEKTQKLLNDSYWAYYNNLQQYQKHDCDDKLKLSTTNNQDLTLPVKSIDLTASEIHTLEQCTVLSSMINNSQHTKELFINGTMKSYSDPTMLTGSRDIKKLLETDRSCTRNSINASSLFMDKVQRKYAKPEERKLLKVKTIGNKTYVPYLN